MQWLPGGEGGVLPYMANTGMCLWTEHCPSTKSRHTRHKRAIIKRHLISTNRNIHPYIIQIRTQGKLSFLDILTVDTTPSFWAMTDPYIGSRPLELNKLAATYIIFFLRHVNGFWEENVMEPLSMLVPCSSFSRWRCCLRCAKRWSLFRAFLLSAFFFAARDGFQVGTLAPQKFSGKRGIPATCWIKRCHCVCMRNCSWFSECKHCLTHLSQKKRKTKRKN